MIDFESNKKIKDNNVKKTLKELMKCKMKKKKRKEIIYVCQFVFVSLLFGER